MSSLRARVEKVDRETWLREFPRFRDGNYRQTWAFAQAGAERVGALDEALLIYEGDELIGATHVRIKSLPIVRGGIAYITGGPMTQDRSSGCGGSADIFARCIDALVHEYVVLRSLTLRIVAPIGPESWNCERANVMESKGFQRTDRVGDYQTILLDIDRPSEKIRSALLQKWRNCLNKSERQELLVESGTDQAYLERFAALFENFVSQKKFSVDLKPDFYEAVQRVHADSDRFFISLAVKDGVDIAGLVSSMDGDTCVYLLGASLHSELKRNATYLLQWHTITAARERDMRWYDLGGIDPDGNPGVYKFKRGLNGQEVQAAGPYEFRASGMPGILTNLAEDLYHRLKLGG